MLTKILPNCFVLLCIVAFLTFSIIHWGLLVVECGWSGSKCVYELKPEAYDWYSFAMLHSPMLLGCSVSVIMCVFVWNDETWRMRFVIGMVILVGVAVILASAYHWSGLQGDEAPSNAVRNIGLAAAAPLLLIFTAWRARIADAQSNTAHSSMLNERYQHGAEMLGNTVLAVRLAGIYQLQRLGQDHPSEYHIQIVRLLCSFIRHPTIADDSRSVILQDDEHYTVREDVQVAMDAVNACRHKGYAFEQVAKFRPNLTGADLRRANLSGFKLSNVDLPRAKMGGVYMRNADLTGAYLWCANLFGAHLDEVNFSSSDLSKANLCRANLTKAKLWRANVSGTAFNDPSILQIPTYFAIGLTQEQLSSACAALDDPPILHDVRADDTGDFLVPPDSPCVGTQESPRPSS